MQTARGQNKKKPSSIPKRAKRPAAPQKGGPQKLGVIPFKIGYSAAGKARRRLVFNDEVPVSKPAVNQTNQSIKPKLSPKSKSLANRSNQSIKPAVETATTSKGTRRSPPSAVRFQTDTSASPTPSPPPPIKKRKKRNNKKKKYTRLTVF